MYAGGLFSVIGGQAATSHLAKLDATTAAVDASFAPTPNSAVNALAFTNGTLYAGGAFTTIGGSGQTATPRLAKLDPATGAVDTTFAPMPNNTVSAITVFGGTLYAGGSFTSANGPANGAGYAQFTDPVSPTITFTSTVPTNATVGDTYTVTATGGGSTAPVTFSIDASSTTGTCTITGAAVSNTGAGTCVVDANQAADSGFAAAAQARQSFAISAPAVVSAPLTGSAPAVVSASLTPSTFTYETVNAGAGAASQSKTFTLTNTGGQSIAPQAPTLTGNDQADYVIGSVRCAVTLQPGDACTYVVKFAPVTVDATYDASAQLNIQYVHGSVPAATATSILSGRVNETPVHTQITGISATGTTIVWCEGAGCRYPTTRLRFELNRGTTVRLVLVRTRLHGRWKQVATSTLRGHAGVNRDRIAGRWHGHLVSAGRVQIFGQIQRDHHWTTVKTVRLTVRHTR